MNSLFQKKKRRIQSIKITELERENGDKQNDINAKQQHIEELEKDNNAKQDDINNKQIDINMKQ